MKIIRDGKEIQLTDNEIYNAYKEYHRADIILQNSKPFLAQQDLSF